MKLIAKKPCSFGGRKFYVGDEIPAELVLNPEAQEKMGVLSQVKAEGEPAPGEPVESPITILVPVDEGNLALEVTREGLQDVFSVLNAKKEDAEPIVQKMTDEDALILLHLTDNRKTIKVAAEERAKAIYSESVGEQ